MTKNFLQITQRHTSVVHLRGKRLAETVQEKIITDGLVFAALLHGAVLWLRHAASTIKTRTPCNSFQVAQEMALRLSITVGENQRRVTSFFLPLLEHGHQFCGQRNTSRFVVFYSEPTLALSGYVTVCCMEDVPEEEMREILFTRVLSMVEPALQRAEERSGVVLSETGSAFARHCRRSQWRGGTLRWARATPP